MKKSLLAFAFTAMIPFTSFAQSEITFATEATYPPFEQINDQGEIVGFDIDVANALCDEMHKECKFVNRGFDTLVPGLAYKKFDAIISAMDITAERKKVVNFSNPYFGNNALFVAVSNNIKNVGDLTGKKVGVQNGTTHQQYIMEQLNGVETANYASLQDAFNDLMTGRIDAVFGDTAVVNDEIKVEPSIHTISKIIDDPKYFSGGLGVAVNKSNPKLLKEINAALATIKANGKYQEIHNKYFTK